MQPLRQLTFFARLVLAWFVLSLGVAVASPLVQPVSGEMVCSAGGVMKLLPVGDGGGKATAVHHTLECPLCAAIAAPPPVFSIAAGPASFAAIVPAPSPDIRVVTTDAAPPPARGPPAPSFL